MNTHSLKKHILFIIIIASYFNANSHANDTYVAKKIHKTLVVETIYPFSVSA